MATILVLAHQHGAFAKRSFLVAGLFPHWEAAGHRVLVHEGLQALPEADVALLHVDLTVVPAPYLEALRRYPKVLNGATADIGKRAFSQHLLGPRDAWDGRVIIKTNRNCGGMPEAFHRQNAVLAGEEPGPPFRVMRSAYPVLGSVREVPPGAWVDPDLVIEKFLPEEDERGFYVRNWTFFGDRERCNRILGKRPVVKAADVLERVPVPVPEELRALRRKLGFDYGKFDFVLHRGEPVLLDVNRTPTVPANLSDALQAGMAQLAPGLEALL